MTQKYELIGLFATKANDILAEKTLAELAKTVGFKVVEVDKWGIKPLAYPINKETKAYYVRLVLEGGDAKKLEVSLRAEETLMRALLVKIEEPKKK